MIKYIPFNFEKFESNTDSNLGILSNYRVNFNQSYNSLDDDARILLEEFSAIIEFDQGLSRDESESIAWKYIIQKD
jgi:hypothetical protein